MWALTDSRPDIVLPQFGVDETRERALLSHYEHHFGVARSVLFCIREPDHHLDIYPFAPTPARPYITLVTVGMSFHAMAAPEMGSERMDRVELLMYLDADWDFDSPLGNVPVDMLRATARYPKEHDTWFSYGDSIAPGDRPAVPGSVLTATLLSAPPEPASFQHLDFGDGSACHFLWKIPITDAELYTKLEKGAAVLEQQLTLSGYRTLDVDRNCSSSVENRMQRRAREKARKTRGRLPRARTVQQLRCEMREHEGEHGTEDP